MKQDTPLCDEVVPLGYQSSGGVGSTDVGDVSWVVPTAQIRGATYAIGTPGHSWQLTAQGQSPLAKKGMVHAAKVMAATAVDALRNPGLIGAAKTDHDTQLGGRAFVNPIPDDVDPPIGMHGRAM